MYDVIVIGAGPAGVAAGIYSARKKLKTLVLTELIGGQSAVSATIENWIGDVSIPGYEFAKKLETHLRAQEDIKIHTTEKVTHITDYAGFFKAKTSQGNEYSAKTVIYTAGAQHRHLNVPGEETFAGHGVVYCSTCDAPFYRDKTVAVIGAGNSGLEACQDLFPYAKKIYLLSNSDSLGGDAITQEEVKNHKKVEIRYNALTQEIVGEKVVTGLRYKHVETSEEITLDLDGVFVEIGMVSNTSIVGDLVKLNDWKEIVIDHQTAETSLPGLFAAGDCVDTRYKQNNIAAGLGCVAALSAYEYIKKMTV